MDIDLFQHELSELMTIMFRLNRSLSQGKDCGDFRLVSPMQMQALIVIKKSGALNMTELAERLLMTRQQLTKVISAFVKKELVVRGSDPKNRRHVIISLSEKGERFLEDLVTSNPNGLSQFLSVLDDSDSRKLLDAMVMVREVLSNVEMLQSRTENPKES